MSGRHVTSHGLTWVVNDGTDDFLGPSGHEDQFLTMCRMVLPAEGTFVDVGAHVGLYACRLGAHYRDGKVIALEANPKTFDTLCENVIINELENVHPRNLAAWCFSGEVLDLYDAAGKASGGSTGAVKIGEAVQVGQAHTTTLNDLLALEDRVDLIKIDVEGAELQVLQGADEILAEFKPRLFVEMHDCYLEDGPGNRKAVEDFLEQNSYVHGGDIAYGGGGGYHWMCRHKETK